MRTILKLALLLALLRTSPCMDGNLDGIHSGDPINLAPSDSITLNQ